METLLRDLRVAIRRLGRRRGFTMIAVLSLGLGIGANTAIFSLVDAIVLRDPAVHDPERLIEIYMRDEGFAHSPLSYADYRDVLDASGGLFTGVAASKLSMTQRDLGDQLERVPVELVSGNYFDLLGLRAAVGRLIRAEDDVAPGAHAVVVLAYDYWQRAFNGDAGVLGQEIRLQGRPYTIVGVAPPGYGGNLRAIAPFVYLPISMTNVIELGGTDQLVNRGSRSFWVKGRLADGRGLPQVEVTLAALAQQLQRQYPRQWPASANFVLVRTSNVIINPSIDRIVVPAAGLLMAVVGLVLLVACANLASFLLAQARDRRREVAIRLALGASRGTLVRQLLTESVLLALIGGVLGVTGAMLTVRLLTGMDLPLPLPITLGIRINGAVLGYALAVSVAAALLFGLAPALQATRPGLAGTLREEGTGGGGPRRVTLRGALVVGQVAVSFMLLVAAVLFVRSFQARQDVNPGFGDEPAAMVWMGLPADRYPEERGRVFVRDLLERVAALPGVTAVGLTGNPHLNTLNTSTMGVNVDGFSPPEGQQAFSIDRAVVDAGYFEAVGTAILRGRNFDVRDVTGGEPVAVINQEMAERFWPGADPVGRTFRTATGVMRVVGVAANARIRTLGEEPRAFIYLPWSQNFEHVFHLIAQTSGNAERAVRDVFSLVRELDRDIVVFEARTMQRHLEVMLLPARLGAFAFSALAVLALALALIGLYGVVSYAVARRAREVGIRLALGAEPASVVRMLMGSGLQLVGVGAALGLVLALAGTRVLQSLLFGVTTLDPITFAAVPVLLLGVAVLATWLPARRATRLDPARTLRSE